MENDELLESKEENLQTSQNVNWYSHRYWAVFAIIASITTIIGFILSIYLYYESKEYPELTFTVHPVRAVLLQKGQSSNLSASFEGKPLEGDVTTAQVAIWNNGKKAIKYENILNNQRSIQIKTENAIPILEAKVRKVSREVTQCSINTEQISTGIINVSWQILEQNDGCVVQIIYEGNSNQKFQIIGSIEGQNLINTVEPEDKIKSAQEQYDLIKNSKKFEYFFYVTFALMVFVFIWDFTRDFKNPKTKSSVKKMLMVGLILTVLCSIWMIYIFFTTHSLSPPFGFDNLNQ